VVSGFKPLILELSDECSTTVLLAERKKKTYYKIFYFYNKLHKTINIAGWLYFRVYNRLELKRDTLHSAAATYTVLLHTRQGTLNEEEGSLQLTSFLDHMLLLMQELNEINHTEPFPSGSFPWTRNIIRL
jgi:hypothetical protein